MKVFYSWQSDIDGKINRYFIFEAVKKAVENLKKEGAFDIEIDQATRGEPGTPDIPDTILRKIDEASIFIADVTFINDKNENRRTPNPNVLIELGYAIKKHGFEKILLIFNEEFGKPKELPFDINHRKPMQYHYNSSLDRKACLKTLTKEFERAILLIDKKTITKEKVDLRFYNREKGKPDEKILSMNSVIYKRITEDDFIKGIDFEVIRKIKNERKLTEWQEYLYNEKKKYEERKTALAAMRGMTIINEWAYTDPDETKDYYKKYMAASLVQLNNCKFDLSIRNNNEQAMKSIKIILKTERKNRVKRAIDFPDLPWRSTLTALAYGIPQNTEQVLFQRKEDGDYDIFEYLKDNLYADEEYILDEPLYISLQENGLIKIEYTIFSENLQKINGVLEINMMNEKKELSPIDVFCKL